MLPVKKEFPYDKIGSYINTNPYTIAFVYPKDSDAFVLKGGSKDVSGYLEKLDIVAAVNKTFWKRGVQRNFVIFYGINAMYSKDSKKGKYTLLFYKDKQRIEVKKVRRIPRKWPVELNQYV